MRMLLDSNILIRWLEPDNPDELLVVAAIDRLMFSGTDLCFTSQNLGEFWNAMTRPINRNGYGLSPEGADFRARKIEAEFNLLPDSPQIFAVWRKLLVAYRVCGVQVHDARLVAAMHLHGVGRILTFNTKDFARFDSIEAVHPSQIS